MARDAGASGSPLPGSRSHDYSGYYTLQFVVKVSFFGALVALAQAAASHRTGLPCFTWLGSLFALQVPPLLRLSPSLTAPQKFNSWLLFWLLWFALTARKV